MTEPREDATARDEPWHWWQRLAFRFASLFLLLLALPFPFGFRGFGGSTGDWWEASWSPVVPWIATHVLQISANFPRYGGAETTWFYIERGILVVLAVGGAILWSSIDRKRRDYRRLDQWLRIYVRLFLASALMAYGWTKVLPVQMPELGPERLSQTFGEASPNGLLWAFMGFSPSYMAFAGAGELIAGVLLCFRRTTTLGALIGIAVMSNVVAMNFAYDVGVKLDAMFYLIGLVYLALPDATRLASVLVLNRATRPAPRPVLATRPWVHRLGVVVPAVFGLLLFLRYGQESWARLHQSPGRLGPVPPLYGLYDVEWAARNGVRHSLVPNDTTLWSRVAIGRLRSTIRRSSGTLGFYVAAVDTARRSVRFTSRDDPTEVFDLTYERPDTGQLVLRGQLGEDSIELLLRRRDHGRYRLVSHPFHWIHDTNENR